MLETCLGSALWVFPLWLYLSCHLKGDSLSSHMGCPPHPSDRWLNYAARQAGMKEPMLLKRGDGRFTFPEDWSGPLVWLVTCSHPISCPLKGTLAAALSMAGSDQPSGNVNLLAPTATGSPRGLPAAPSIGTISKWPHRSYQYLTADFSEKAFQLGVLSSHFSFPMDGLNWHYSAEFGGTPLISPAERFYCISHAAIACSYEIHRHLSRHPCFFHVFIRRIFSSFSQKF